MFAHSIRWRLQLWLGFLLLCVLTGFGVAVYELQRINTFKDVDEELEGRLAQLITAVRRPPFPMGMKPFDKERPPVFPDKKPAGEPYEFFPDTNGRPPESIPGEHRGPPRREIHLDAAVNALFGGSASNGFFYLVWSRDGDVLKTSDHAPEVFLPAKADDSLTRKRTREELREAFHFTELGECVLVGRSIAEELRTLREYKLFLSLAGGVVLAIGLGVGWWLTTSAIRPIEEISAAASRISAGNLSERVFVPNSENELGRLAGVLNMTFARLQAAFDRQKQFTGDAAHELRTPLAVLISETQSTLARERTAAEYRETVEACLQTAQEMRQLTESLLHLARLDEGTDTSVKQEIDLAEIARNCVERMRPLADERQIKIQTDLETAKILGQESRSAQLITNLLSNAIYYNKPGGDVRVRTITKDLKAVLIVEDTGQGIAAKDLPRIFERFFRADKSRSRAGGRNGLGLAICQEIVRAEGGEIHVTSEPGRGTTFTVAFVAR